jgi:hypothetical protein
MHCAVFFPAFIRMSTALRGRGSSPVEVVCINFDTPKKLAYTARIGQLLCQVRLPLSLRLKLNWFQMRLNTASRCIAALWTGLSVFGQPLTAFAVDFKYQVPIGATNQAIAPGQLAFTPVSYDFGTLVLGSSASTTLSLKNTGQDALNLSELQVAAPYSQTNNCPANLVGGAACTVTLTYVPDTAGIFPGVLKAVADGGVSSSLTLTGSAVVPTTTLALSVNAVDFYAVDVGTSSNVKTITLTNTGNSLAAVNGMSVSSGTADFNQSNDCAALPPGGSCTISVLFSPGAYGPRAGNLTLYEQKSGTLYSVSLTGFGNSAVMAVSPPNLTFSSAIENYSTSTTQLTVTNAGNRPLTGLSFDTNGFSEFTITGRTCTTTLDGATNCIVAVSFAPSAAGARPGTLSVYSTNAGSASISLAGLGTAQAPAVVADVSSLTFADTPVDGTSAVKQVTFTNTGNVRVALGGVSLVAGTGQYTTTSTCGVSLEVGASCLATIAFTPHAAGPQAGTLRATFASGNVDVTLSGAGTLGQASVSPASLTFADQQVASTSAAKTITVTNTGNRKLTVSGISVTTGASDFGQSNTCAVIDPNGTCTISVAFTPTAAGPRTGTVTIAHDGVDGITTLDLAGTGRAPSASLSTPTFAATAVGSSSTATATLSNTGIDALSVTVPSAASVAGQEYSFVSTTCGTSVAAGAACTVTLKFSPTSTAPASGTLSFNTEAGVQSTSFGSTGIQGYASISPASLTFAAQQTGTTSAVQAVTVTNTGTDVLTFSGVGIATGAAHFGQSNTCASVPVNGSCSISVSFTPSAMGYLSGSVGLTHNGGGIAVVNLFGTGQAPSASLSAPSFATTAVGSSTTATATLTNTGIAAISVTAPTAASVSGADFSFVSTTCGSSLSASSSCSVTVRFSPTSTAARSGTLSFATGAGTVNASLNATGVQGGASWSVSSLTFATQQVSTSSAVQTVTVTNSGTAPLTISSVAVSTGSADYSQASPGCTTLVVNGSCTISVTFTPSTPGARPGTITLVHNGSGSSSISLSGTGQAQGGTLSTPSFPATAVGAQSTATATLTNTGVGPLSVTVPSSASVTGSAFSFVSTTCGSSVAVGANCTVTVKFAPTSTAAASGTLTVNTGAGSLSAPLGSTGIQGYASVSPASLTFTAQQTSTTSAVQTITVTNTGTNVLTFTGVGVATGSAHFGQSNTCGSVVVNGTCTISVSFTPSATGSLSGSVGLTHNGGGVAVVNLTGTGQAPSATLSTPSFSTTAVGSNSTATATLTNTGIASISVTTPNAASVTGTDFSFVSTTCGTSLAASTSCTVTVRFSPTSTAARSGSLSFATGAGTMSASLNSTGVQGNASLSTSSLTFGNRTISSSSAGQSVTLTNNGSAPLMVSGVAISSGSADFSQSGGCNTTLAINGTCTMTVTFTPSAAGARSGTLSFTTNGSGATSVSLSGTGVAAASITSLGFSPTAVAAGTTSTFSWATSNASSASVSCSAPASGSGSGTSGSITVSTSATGTGTCTVTAANAAGSSVSQSASLTVNPAYTYAWNASTWSTPSACGSTTSTRTVWCQRSDGATVADALCSGGKPAASQAATDYSSCTYSWQTSGWSVPSGCGSVTQTRSVWCQRSDGTTVADASCGGGKPASSGSTTDYSNCSYSYSYGGWGSCSSSCGTGSQSRSATCMRSDGTSVSNSYCGTATTSQSCSDYSGCAYSYVYGGWSGCSNSCGTGTQSRSATCQRSDGATVSNSYCGTATTSQSCSAYTGCSYTANVGSWSTCSGSCGTTGTQTRSVSCTRSDGATVANSYCGSPATSQSCQMEACAPVCPEPTPWCNYWAGQSGDPRDNWAEWGYTVYSGPSCTPENYNTGSGSSCPY